jgi:hypothetical protein
MKIESNEREDQLSGEHTSGEMRLMEENRRKDHFYSLFHTGLGHINEHHSDRNKMGKKDPQSGYE